MFWKNSRRQSLIPLFSGYFQKAGGGVFSQSFYKAYLMQRKKYHKFPFRAFHSIPIVRRHSPGYRETRNVMKMRKVTTQPSLTPSPRISLFGSWRVWRFFAFPTGREIGAKKITNARPVRNIFKLPALYKICRWFIPSFLSYFIARMSHTYFIVRSAKFAQFSTMTTVVTDLMLFTTVPLSYQMNVIIGTWNALDWPR